MRYGCRGFRLVSPKIKRKMQSLLKKLKFILLKIMDVYTIIVTGDTSTGKTTICNFITKKYQKIVKRPVTIGCDFFCYKKASEEVHIWDTCGQQIFHGLANYFCKKTHAIIIIFKNSNFSSLKKAEQTLKNSLVFYKDKPIYIISNKFKYQENICQNNFKELLSKYNVMGFNIDLSTNKNSAIEVIDKIIKHMKLIGIKPINKKISNTNNTAQKCCCFF